MKRAKFLAVCLLLFTVFCLSSCQKKEYDYTAEELVITEVDFFAPCYFYEFLRGNEYTSAYFDEIIAMVTRASYFEVTINGETWERIRIYRDKLPQGVYDIEIETPSDFYMVEQTETGLEKVYYHKKMTVPVVVFEFCEDKYSIVRE